MANPLPTGDPARAALDLSDEILARLDAATTEQTESPAEPTLEDKLKEIETRLNAALDASDEAGVRRLAEEAKAAVRAEKARREKNLEDAQDAFDTALKEQGEQAEDTTRSASEVANWQKSLLNYDDYIAQMDRFYDEIPEGMHIDNGSVVSKVHAEPAQKERRQSLEELLEKLEKTKAAYLARLEEVKKEQQSVADLLVQERIAKLKESIGS